MGGWGGREGSFCTLAGSGGTGASHLLTQGGFVPGFLTCSCRGKALKPNLPQDRGTRRLGLGVSQEDQSWWDHLGLPLSCSDEDCEQDTLIKTISR